MEIDEKVRHVLKGTEQCITREDLAYKFMSAEKEKRSLVVKMGVDPTSPEIHIGHTVPLRTLKRFQDVGHEITFLIGDFTARIGDPSGKSSGRKALSEEEVLENAKTYTDQVFKILDQDLTRVVYNSSWLKPLVLEDVISLLSRNTVNNLVKRNSFVKRFDAGESIAGHELIYPYLQAFDSVALKADVEIGGSDQYFNLLFGRDLQPRYGQEPQVVMTTPLLEGLDGNEKMSKTLGNTVGLDASPRDMYAKIMTVKDHLMGKYLSLLTDVDDVEIGIMEAKVGMGQMHPMEMKKLLAREITAQFHSQEDVRDAEAEFVRVYSLGELPENIETVVLRGRETVMPVVSLITASGLADTNSQARRLISQRGFSIDGVIVEDPYVSIPLDHELVLRAGKRRYVKVAYERE